MTSTRAGWIRMALLAGAAYIVIGRAFAGPSTQAVAWRWAAWVVSAFVYAVHIASEQWTLRNPPRAAAMHVAVGVAIGGLGLAVGAMMHNMALGRSMTIWWISLVVWPVMTGLPSFVVAYVAALGLSRLAPRASSVV